MKHELKIWPSFYQAVSDKRKTFEIRVNDRGFQAGDIVVLCEWDPDKESIYRYTGNKLYFEIGYVLPIDDKRVVFSLLPATSTTV